MPGQITLLEFDRKLYDFLMSRTYATDLHWCADAGVRDTGPFIDGRYHGTHPAVRIYYSPEVVAWLRGRREGELPDGATIVKEMFTPPAARYEDMKGDELAKAIAGWTVMIRNRAGSYDGWFWSGANHGTPPKATDHFPAESGFGLSCLRCHASAEKEYTFSTANNIAGFDGEPLRYRVDNSWRDVPAQEKPWSDPHDFAFDTAPVASPNPKLNESFVAFFTSIDPTNVGSVQRFPREVHDTVVAARGEPDKFLSADQCMMCHGGLSAPPGPEMFLVSGPVDPETYITPGFNVSPYGEWRRSPMGLGGRDPIFFAQLESELAILAEEFRYDPGRRDRLSTHLVDTCLSCHGVMGHRQHKIDAGPGQLFDREWVFTLPDDSEKRRWGALARGGVGCTVCHHARPAIPPGDYDGPSVQYFLENATTGQFTVGPAREIYGPFKDVATFPMESSLGIEPKHDSHIQSSRLCGSCHTINLPNIDKPIDPAKHRVLDRIEKNPVFKPYYHSIEQATYLEWLNSQYENELNPGNPEARSCQDCHMPRGFDSDEHEIHIPQIATRIASIQDDSYPYSENTAPLDDISVRFRTKGYARHEFLGLNAFLLEMFAQFPDVLGVAPSDFMTSSISDQQHAVDNLVRQARQRTATVEFDALQVDPDARARTLKLTADVRATNLTGHRLPSGVGFRRVFLEFLVLDATRERPLFASGRTNRLGVLVDEDGRNLRSEFFAPGPDGKQEYQKHHTTITSDKQVQIYEELVHDGDGRFTTSFIHRDQEVKDNRLLPKGWSPEGPRPEIYPAISEFMDATRPGERARSDPDYKDGSGSDVVRYEVSLPPDVNLDNVTVKATLYSQSIPPYYLRMRFTTAPDGPATRRLYYLTSHLNLADTPIEDWKLQIASTNRRLR